MVTLNYLGNVMEYLIGEYEHQMDTKNRIRIPNKLKGDAKELYFSMGSHNCIAVYFEDEFKKFMAKIGDVLKMGDEASQKKWRMLAKSFARVEGDTQGRMILPLKLKQYAKIERDIVICGAGNHIEIWSKATYDEYFDQDEESVDSLFQNLGI